MIIREATSADYPELREVYAARDAYHREALPHLFRQADAPFPPNEHVTSLIENPEAVLLVAEDAGRVVGFLQARVTHAPDHLSIFVPRRYAFVDSMAVLPGFRHRGVGSSLLHAAESWAQKQGLSEIELTVFEFNLAALNMYEAAGYTTMQRRLWKRLSDSSHVQ